MKKVFLFVVLFLVTNLFGQTIDFNHFNYTLLETKVLEKINEYRKTKKLPTLVISETLKINTSNKTASTNALRDSLFHLPIVMDNYVLNKKLYNELYTFTNGKCGDKEPGYISMERGCEIILMLDKFFSTYDSMATYMLNGWLGSPKHKAIIESDFIFNGDDPSFFSCTIKKSKTGKYYASVNFATISGF